jgi:putative membrane protein
MNTLLYFVVMAAAFMGLPYVLKGVHVDGWGPAFVGAFILAVANTILKPVLFVLTLPFTIVTLGLFLLVLNALMLALTDWLVAGIRIDTFVTTFVAALILSLVGMVWKAATKEEKKQKPAS